MWIPNVSNVILKIDDIEKFHSMMSGTKYFALSLTAKAYCACSKPLMPFLYKKCTYVRTKL